MPELRQLRCAFVAVAQAQNFTRACPARRRWPPRSAGQIVQLGGDPGEVIERGSRRCGFTRSYQPPAIRRSGASTISSRLRPR